MKRLLRQWFDAWGTLVPREIEVFLNSDISGDGTTHPDRVYIFAGRFASEAEMFAYCFTPVTLIGPEQLNLDLPEASVSTQMIDAAFSDQILPRLSEYFGRKERRRIMAKLAPEDAVVLIPARAFDGMAFRIHDTPRLRLLGYEQSLTMAAMAAVP